VHNRETATDTTDAGADAQTSLREDKQVVRDLHFQAVLLRALKSSL
jgi:hypothetical protein